MVSILTLTLNPTIDKSAEVDHVISEKKLRCRSPRYEPGGGGLNVSRAIQQLGGASEALYLAGGLQGRRLQDLLDEGELNHRPVPIAESTRENLIIYEDKSGEQYRFGMPGPEVSEPEWRGLLDSLRDRDPTPDYLVASGSQPPGVPDDFYARLARLCRDKGTRMILDASGAPLVEAAREGVFLIKPNVTELKTLAGEEDFEDENHLEELACRLTRDRGAEVVVASLGAAGAMLVWEDQCRRLRAPTVPIKSKVGAGDSMVAGIVLGLARGHSIIEAARFGVAAGAAAVMTPGTELCRKEDTERLYRQMAANDRH